MCRPCTHDISLSDTFCPQATCPRGPPQEWGFLLGFCRAERNPRLPRPPRCSRCGLGLAEVEALGDQPVRPVEQAGRLRLQSKSGDSRTAYVLIVVDTRERRLLPLLMGYGPTSAPPAWEATNITC